MISLRSVFAVPVISAALLGAACGGGGDSAPPVLTGKFRAVNGISDTPTSTQNAANPGADVSLSGSEDPRLQNLPFPSVSNERTYAVGAYGVTFSVRNNAGTVVIDSVPGVPIESGKLTTVYSGGAVNSGTQTGFVVETTIPNAIFVGASVLGVHDAASGAPISLYATAPADAAFPGTTPPVNLAFKGSAAVPAPQSTLYRLRVTQQGQPANVLFDSGPNGVPLLDGTTYQLAVMDNPASEGGSAYYLLLFSDNPSDSGAVLVNGAN